MKVFKVGEKYILLKVISSGLLENNKGVTLHNRKIKLDFLTEKDFMAIKIARALKVRNFALSFTNSINDINKFNMILKDEKKIFKIETKLAIKNILECFLKKKLFLIFEIESELFRNKGYFLF